MRSRVFLNLSLVLVFGSIGVGRVAGRTTLVNAEQMRTLVEGNCAFAVESYRQLRSSEGNLFFSPYSVSCALALAYGGARGETEKQMAQVLHFSLDQKSLHVACGALQNRLNAIQKEGGFKLALANSLWPQQDYRLLDTYLSLAKTHYGVSITPADYRHAAEATRQKINLWVDEKTQHAIKDLIAPGLLNETTRLVLVNAIYFKGTWGEQFDPRSTRETPFHVSPGKTVPVPMMTQTETMGYAESETLQVLSMAYRGGGLSMVVLLPRSADSLKQLENEVSVETLKSWRKLTNSRRVQVFLPRFRVTKQFLLNDLLKAMGMTAAFRAPGADFSAMTATRGLFLSAVIHQAVVDVNEKGTEAAAATAVGDSIRGTLEPPEPPVVVRADHPFLFFIQDNATGTILFLGRLTDPTKSGQ